MRAISILQQKLSPGLKSVHLARSRLIFAAAHALLLSGRLSLTSLGRAIAGRASHKHGIKRMDRLLGNRKLHGEMVTFYRAIARQIVPKGSRPVIIVDWTSVTPKLWALVAAVPFQGRALVIYAETHPTTRYQRPKVNKGFLLRLQKVLPSKCTPIVVTDAGFRSPWMKLVINNGWDYVGRVRHALARSTGERGWVPMPMLWKRARRTPIDFGQFELGRQVGFPCRMVGVRQRGYAMTARVMYETYQRGVAKLRRDAKEPWVLATSLTVSASKVVSIYRTRMMIEETFRDAKSTRFGLALNHARTRSYFRANVLLLLASLAHLAAVLVGISAEAGQFHLKYQANTERRRRVLSLAALGRLVVVAGDDDLIKEPVWPEPILLHEEPNSCRPGLF